MILADFLINGLIILCYKICNKNAAIEATLKSVGRSLAAPMSILYSMLHLKMSAIYGYSKFESKSACSITGSGSVRSVWGI